MSKPASASVKDDKRDDRKKSSAAGKKTSLNQLPVADSPKGPASKGSKTGTNEEVHQETKPSTSKKTAPAVNKSSTSSNKKGAKDDSRSKENALDV